MKICFIIDAHTVLSQRIAEYFADKGHDILILSSISKYPNDHKNIKIKELGAVKKRIKVPYTEHLGNIMKVKKEVTEYDPDVVHGHYITSVASQILNLDNKYPVVLSAWGSDILVDSKAKHHKILFKKAFKRADKLTSVSDHITKKMIELGADFGKITTFPFGVDTTIFKRISNVDKLRTKLGIEKKEIVVISTRMFEPVYNIEILLDAIPDVITKKTKVKVILIGTGSLEDELKKRAVKLNLTGNVIFTGFIPHRELSEYLNLADIYVSTSVSDGASASLLEAMACGVFPVVTDIPANKEWIENNENGFLFKIGDIDSLTEQIIKALDRSELRTAAIKENRKKVMKKASWTKNMGKLEEIYNEVIKEKG